MAIIKLSLRDRLIVEAQSWLRTSHVSPMRATPAASLQEVFLEEKTKAHTAALMRVNHCGEVCAQALYHGQAIMALTQETYDHLFLAAEEERDHLSWCAMRVSDLGGKTSILAGVFYIQSLLLGVIVACFGDAISLGFINETERQVILHLQEHIEQLDARDLKTLAVLQQMALDEEKHGADAIALGGEELPIFVQRGMRLFGLCMTKTTYFI